MNLRILIPLFFLGCWFGGAVVANRWIDGLDRSDTPNYTQLVIARFVWSVSPAINRDTDVRRAEKFSWLVASGYINRKGRKEVGEILNVLEKEMLSLGGYLARNSGLMTESAKRRVYVQLLTYLNRFELYQAFANPALESKLRELATSIAADLDPSTVENWYREMMIRSFMKGDVAGYQFNQTQLADFLRQHLSIEFSDFREGALSFYDGVLACIASKPDLAVAPLEFAAQKLSKNPDLAVELFYDDLNVLLFSKGMKAGETCNRAILGVISAGG